MENKIKKNTLFTTLLRGMIESWFIIFLFYANLLMGDFTQNGRAINKGFVWAIRDIFTTTNFIIAVVAAILGHFFFQFLRRRL
jgi:hypothetical protein